MRRAASLAVVGGRAPRGLRGSSLGSGDHLHRRALRGYQTSRPDHRHEVRDRIFALAGFDEVLARAGEDELNGQNGGDGLAGGNNNDTSSAVTAATCSPSSPAIPPFRAATS